MTVKRFLLPSAGGVPVFLEVNCALEEQNPFREKVTLILWSLHNPRQDKTCHMKSFKGLQGSDHIEMVYQELENIKWISHML